jgi:hypothetical protein
LISVNPEKIDLENTEIIFLCNVIIC